MKISYHPFYTTLHNCSTDLVKYLSKLLAHNIPGELLEPFKKSTDLILTTNYLFQAFKNSQDLFDVKIYSGLLNTIIYNFVKDEIIQIQNIEFVKYVDKYTCSDLSTNNYLRDHQKNIVNACLINKRGIVKSPTGSGKSITIADLINKFEQDGLTVLVTVPTISLLHQMEKDINDYRCICNLPLLSIGKIGDGIFNPKQVTIGIPNSLVKLDRTKSFLTTVNALLIDEVQYGCNSMYINILQNCTQRKVTLGFSATPELSNDLDKLLEGMVGPRIISITEEDMIEQDIILDPVFKFYNSSKVFVPSNLSNMALNISTMSDKARYKLMPQIYNYVITNNKFRNELILKEGLNQINSNKGPIIIIVNKVGGEGNHADIIRNLYLNSNIDLPIISAYISKKKKESILQDLKDSKIKGVIAGPKILTAGINIPSLNCIILAGAGKSSNDFIQRVGRLLRKKEGKIHPVVIDFYDQQFWFKNQSKARIETAKQIYGEHNIKIC